MAQLRSYPVGLLGVDGKMSSTEAAYNNKAANPLPLKQEHEREYFSNFAKYRTPPLLHPVRKIVFTLRTRDQGTGGEAGTRGTYRAAWSWFEVGLEKFDSTQTCAYTPTHHPHGLDSNDISEIGDPNCVNDTPAGGSNAALPRLPVCALRPIQPNIVNVHDSTHPEEYEYEYPVQPDQGWSCNATKLLSDNTQHMKSLGPTQTTSSPTQRLVMSWRRRVEVGRRVTGSSCGA